MIQRPQSKRRAIIALLIGAIALIPWALGAYGGPLVGKRVGVGETFVWQGEAFYLMHQNNSLTGCQFERSDGATMTFTLRANPRKGDGSGAGLGGMKAMGRAFPAVDRANGSLRCNRTVWIARGPAQALPRLADLGPWYVVPAGLLISGGMVELGWTVWGRRRPHWWDYRGW